MTIVQMTNVAKNFGKVQALKDVSFSIDSGEIYGFIGPNGAGKSTAIRVLLGIIHASAGEATIFGKDVWKDSLEIHKKTAYVPGDVSLWPNLTGGEVIDLLIKLGGGGDEAKRKELIERFQLDPTKKCRTYSKGNRQKVALIGAFASYAELFIFDEPTAGLDPLMERIFHEYVWEVKAAGKSVMLSSHILSEVEKLCDKVGIIRNGEVIESGTLDELRHLTRLQMYVETSDKLQGIEEHAGIHDVVREGEAVHFQVDADKMNGVIRYLSAFDIRKLESHPPTLEDLFMRYYEEGSETR
ncbi:ABC transporter ATP-binding protein [Alkalicoccus halolimnae]|uniref:ABC transporter ATP-binding protein n=1 Tax=Alkalicoccus halolimnae TaxID=1667239 RepID=A0A5C7F677_9BACI|nr:ABC transporter ATP-binding protein [Alkalicoccus halolimnae]TXF86231.1 ABC transporter ATP-binding protein [Alkalicoccus halolimnae]